MEEKEDVLMTETEDKSRPSGTNASLLKTLFTDVAMAVAIAAAVLYFISPVIVRQSSMENTLHDGDYLVMSRAAYRGHDPKRGDIIIFRSTLDSDAKGKGKLLIKRVVGLPGETVKIADGNVYIDGQALDEGYTKDGYTQAVDIPAEGEECTVPENSYFCLGDNRAGSMDSRDSLIGFVDRSQIKGKVVCRLIPFVSIDKYEEKQR